jgi:hypothetical protein
VDIFLKALDEVDLPDAQVDVVDNFVLFLEKIITNGGEKLPAFRPVLDSAFNRITDLPDDHFFLL